jgi:hypothetical protein
VFSNYKVRVSLVPIIFAYSVASSVLMRKCTYLLQSDDCLSAWRNIRPAVLVVYVDFDRLMVRIV